MPDEVELHAWSAEPCNRRMEPVTVGVPWPRGALRDASHLTCVGPDGSVRWVLCDLLLSATGNGATGYRLVAKPDLTPQPPLRSGEGESDHPAVFGCSMRATFAAKSRRVNGLLRT